MKTKLLVIIASLFALTASAQSFVATNAVGHPYSFTITVDTNGVQTIQTNAPIISGPIWDALQFLSSGSNWIVAPYGIYDTGTKSLGAGIGVGYKVNEFLVPNMRLDYINGKIWQPAASLQLQAPLTLFGKLTFVPFGFAGVAIPLSGKGNDNGDAVSLYGIGGAIRLGKGWDLLGDYEKWGGYAGHQLRFGFAKKL